ncbi:metal ABC transporter permease [Dialister succinatiphilus]|uniref:metal ABC transporter permease n=1 Tax=Dialister succinatiphilus TaxID=487173 RepID=UPI003F7EC4D9
MFSYDFMQNALFISICIAILCPCIGIFIVLKRYSMIGDTLAHSSLAGVTLGLLFRESPVLASFAFTALSGFFIEFLRQYFKKYTDLILSIVLSVSVGIAITLISSGHLHANADAYLFGSMLTVSPIDMAVTAVLSLFAVVTVILNYHQLLYITYDEEASRIAGVHVKRLNYLFAFLVAAAISVSIRSVGILVITSMITLPVASALQLQKGFKTTFLASLAYSFLSILSGFFLSYFIGAAPGGVTALTAAFLLLVTIFVKQVLRP